MTGIVSYGASIPRLRLDRKVIFKAIGWFNPATFGAARGEKAVANYDEDTLSLMVEAARDCLKGVGPGAVDTIGALYAGSTTFPYLERQNSAIVVSALDLEAETSAWDIAGSLTAGTSALLSGFQSLGQEGRDSCLVAAADCRVGEAGSKYEHLFGDGAAAFLLGKEKVIASLVGSHSLQFDFPDLIRTEGRKSPRSWEERWVKVAGYSKLMPQAVQGILEKTGKKVVDLAKVCLACPDVRTLQGLARKLGLQPEQVQEPLLGTVGDTGAAGAPLLLAAALESAKPGDLILAVSYGSGCDALLFEATEAITGFKGPRGVSGGLARKAELDNYQKYLVFKDLISVDMGIRGEMQAPSALSVLWRDRRAITGLVGTRCAACGTPQYPPQRICVNPECRALDKGEPYRFSHLTGKVFSYTGDMLASSYEPPAIYGLVDMEGGGRLNLDFTDCVLEEVKVGMDVELSFRRKYNDVDRGLSGYFWKAVPANS